MRTPDAKQYSPIRPAVRSSLVYPFVPTSATIKLDQNECPFDFPEELKEKALSGRSAIRDANPNSVHESIPPLR